jgi:hypothetical protein
LKQDELLDLMMAKTLSMAKTFSMVAISMGVGICIGILIVSSTSHTSDANVDDVGSPRSLTASTKQSAAPIQKAFMTVAAEPDPGYVLALTIVRVILMCYVAPCVLFYGPTYPKATSFVQAIIAAGLWVWWGRMKSIAYIGDMPPVFEGFALLVFSSGTTGLSMMMAEVIDLGVKGALFFYTFSMQLVDILELTLMNWAGCGNEKTKTGLAIRGMRYDAWQDCTKEDEFSWAMWIICIVTWASIILGAILANKLQKLLASAASAMVGAALIADGIDALISDVMTLTSSAEDVAKAQAMMLSMRMILCYLLAGYGFLCQKALAPWIAACAAWKDAQEEDASKQDKPDEAKVNSVNVLFRPIAYMKFFAGPYGLLEALLKSQVVATAKANMPTVGKGTGTLSNIGDRAKEACREAWEDEQKKQDWQDEKARKAKQAKEPTSVVPVPAQKATTVMAA